MIAEYILNTEEGEVIKHRAPVGSPMDNELRRQILYLQSQPGGTKWSRREVAKPTEQKDET